MSTMQADIYQVEHVKNIKFSKNKMKSKMENPKHNGFISIHSVLNVPYKAETWHA